jgi:hypothetical protein
LSEYDPIPPRAPLTTEPSDLERVQARFENASDGYLRSPWSWWAWSLILPAAALLSREVYPLAGPRAVLFLCSFFILCGGLIEGAIILTGSRTEARTPLAGWVLRTQGNLSLVAVALSALLFWQGLAEFVPAVWLLLVGHSFYGIGKLSFQPLHTAGLILQAGGLAALVPGIDGFVAFAGFTFAGCAWIGLGVYRRRRLVRHGRR